MPKARVARSFLNMIENFKILVLIDSVERSPVNYRFRFLPFVLHGIRHPEYVAAIVAEIEIRNAEAFGIAVGPESVEIRMCMERTPGIRVISQTVVRQLSDEFPAFPSIVAAPHLHLAAGSPVLRADSRRSNHRPDIFVVDPDTSTVIAMCRSRQIVENPLPSIPMRRLPLSDTPVRSCQVIVTRKIKDDGISVGPEIDILNVAVPMLGLKIPDQGDVVPSADGQRHRIAVNRRPGFAPILRFDVIDIRPGIAIAVDMPVETAHQLITAKRGELIMP